MSTNHDGVKPSLMAPTGVNPAAGYPEQRAEGRPVVGVSPIQEDGFVKPPENVKAMSDTGKLDQAQEQAHGASLEPEAKRLVIVTGDTPGALAKAIRHALEGNCISGGTQFGEDTAAPEVKPIPGDPPVGTTSLFKDDNPGYSVEQMNIPGFERLAFMFRAAYAQASVGKGVQRHAADGAHFEDQPIFDMAKRFGVGSLLAQAFKKMEESQRLPLERAANELYGAMVYCAAAVIALEDQWVKDATRGR